MKDDSADPSGGREYRAEQRRRRRNAKLRLAKMLSDRRLMFVVVGERPPYDRVISAHAERDGATIEYGKLLRDIVACVKGEG